jgi:hypothetical protein
MSGLAALNFRHFMAPNSRAKSSDDLVDILQALLKHMDERFDRIEFLLSAQERRIAILEDRMRVVGTKLGLEFRSRT